MRLIADRFTVILDANVLYPFYTRDILLSLADAGLYRARWSEDIIEETKRALLRNNPGQEAKIENLIATMQESFPESWIYNYRKLIPALELPDEDDRHVLAASIKADATHIVTENMKHFPSNLTVEYDITPIRPDDFLYNTYELYPEQCVSAIIKMLDRYATPSFNLPEYIMLLRSNGLVNMAQVIQSSRELFD
jgi:predicted nucleic acid-binding protein